MRILGRAVYNGAPDVAGAPVRLPACADAVPDGRPGRPAHAEIHRVRVRVIWNHCRVLHRVVSVAGMPELRVFIAETDGAVADGVTLIPLGSDELRPRAHDALSRIQDRLRIRAA
ncbi:hypothetical protein MycrhDRAFT_0136 [Mycolicibacterium rhodesiae JS60]|nr:hypothetical protein MycrhDRAFT_0136 [Mycolicibacterium rhodesiae JS60]